MRRNLPILIVVVIGALAFAVPSAAGGGCHGTGDPTFGLGDDGATLGIEKCMFTPTVVFVEPGEKVTWVNKDPVPHTVSGVGLSWGSHDYLDRGESATYAFDAEGIYPYYCLLHPSMVGAVVVGDPAMAKAEAEPMEGAVTMLGGSDEGGGPAAGAASSTQPIEGISSGWTGWMPFALVLAAAVVYLVTREARRRRVASGA